MNRIAYWSIMTAAALIAGVLLVTPVWEHFYYRHPAALDLPTAPASLAVTLGAIAPPSAAPVARPSPVEETLPTLGALSESGSATRPGDRQIRVAEIVPTRPPERHAPAAASAALVPGPITRKPTASPPRTSIGASTTTPEVDPATPPPAGSSLQGSPPPAVNQMASIGWFAGGLVAGSPAMTTPDSQSTAPNHDRPAPDGSQQSGSAAAGSGSQDALPLSLSLAPDRQAVSRGETISVKVVLSGARDVTGVPFHIQFDPGVLEYVGARTGPALNGRSLQPIFLASVNPGTPGDLAVGLSLVRSSGTFNGSGAIVLIDFRALAPGRSDLLFDRASVRGAASEPLAAEITGSTAEVR
jgi:Cohesin domain